MHANSTLQPLPPPGPDTDPWPVRASSKSPEPKVREKSPKPAAVCSAKKGAALYERYREKLDCLLALQQEGHRLKSAAVDCC